MFAMISAVANPIFADLGGQPLGFDWGVGGWMLMLLAVLFVPCVASLLKVMIRSLDVSALRVKYRRPRLIVVRPPFLKSS